MAELPREGYVEGKGRVRILRYGPKDYFHVLTCRDEVLFIHRDRIVFTPAPNRRP